MKFYNMFLEAETKSKKYLSFFSSLVLLCFSTTIWGNDIQTQLNQGVHKVHPKPIPEHNFITWSPDKKIHLLGLTLTPGGFLVGEAFWRSRNEQTDVASTYSGIPLGNNPLYHMHEFRLSARQSRVSLLIEGQVDPCTLLSGYYEADFLGNGTANSNESNSFDLRMRNIYLTLDKNDWGLHLLAGQNWSLLTTTLKGITPRNEQIPPTIDAQYVVGFIWKRQPQFRVTANLTSTLWAAVSVENPQTTFGGTPCETALPGISNVICRAPGNHSLPNTSLFSLNHVPDVAAKLAWEDKIADHKFHLEAFGIYRSFYDRVEYTDHHNTNHDTRGYGVGGGAVIELLRDQLDFQGNVMGGRGIGSYASGLLPDVTLGSNGQLKPIPEVVFMMGLTFHVTPCFDIYLFGGREKESRKYFQADNNYFGYGVPNANNLGCNIENGICAGDTREVSQITAGLWTKPYKGVYGEMRVGLQYSYAKRKLFSGDGGEAPNQEQRFVGYSTNENMVFVSVRYYPFT